MTRYEIQMKIEAVNDEIFYLEMADEYKGEAIKHLEQEKRILENMMKEIENES